MITIIKWVILTIYNLLPDSPFGQMVEEMQLNQDFLQHLNWFLPIDIISNMMLAWLSCMLAYIAFQLVVQIVKILAKLWLKSSSIIGYFAGIFFG